MIKPIGIFDWGVGGLTVLKEIKKHLPEENIVYLGDNARTPYGSKSKERVKDISLENSNFLSKFDVKVIVVACNTASAVALDTLRSQLDMPVIGVIDAGVRAAVSSTQNNKIGVIGTRQTISSKAHKNLIENLSNEIQVFTKATPLFAPIVEEDAVNKLSTKMLIKEELEYFKENNVDTLILGCTHYPLLKEMIKEYLPNVNLIDPSQETALEINKVLKRLNISNEESNQYNKFFVTDRPLNFINIGKRFLDSNIFVVEEIDLENYDQEGLLAEV